MMETPILFTPAAIADLLTQIDELSGLDITVYDGHPMKIQIGESTYEIEPESISVEADPETIEEVNEVNESAVDDSYELLEPVESGILKELGKTLLIGGLVRLTAKALKR